MRPYSPPEWMDSEDSLFILYTSGSTGKPKGVAHSSAGYLLNAAMVKLVIMIVFFTRTHTHSLLCTAVIIF